MKKYTKFLVLFLLFLLCGCQVANKIEPIMNLKDSGGNLLIDANYKYSIQFPSNWEFMDTEALNAYRESQVEDMKKQGKEVESRDLKNTAMFMTPYLIPFKYGNIHKNIEETAEEIWEQVKAGILSSGSWDKEQSKFGELENWSADGVNAYRFRLYLLATGGANTYITTIYYIIPLSKDTFMCCLISHEDQYYEELETFYKAMNTFRWTDLN